MNQLYVVGIGPGDCGKMTAEARQVLDESQVIVGYTVYVQLLQKQLYTIPGEKEYIITGMRQERERCLAAIEKAEQGKRVAVVCSGDAGVYGMAGFLMELAQDRPQVEIRVVAGVTAALSGAAVLGAPLGHDFAVISLSDLMTPWEKIEQRLSFAAQADLAICLYNPSSRKRRDYLERACRIVGGFRSPDTVCGYVRNIGREGECSVILPLSLLEKTEVDMFTTVFLGNSQTREIRGQMVTPRGYNAQRSTKAPKDGA